MDLGNAGTIVELVTKAGAVGALLFVLIGGQRRVWVWGHQVTELRADAERRLAEAHAETERMRGDLNRELYWWKDHHAKQREVIDKALVLAEQLTRALERAGERTTGST